MLAVHIRALKVRVRNTSQSMFGRFKNERRVFLDNCNDANGPRDLAPAVK